jgi:hypothetical protein
MKHADAQIAAMALATRQNIQRESLRLYRATVTDVSGGLVSILRTGDTVDEDAGYPVIVPGIPAVDDEVVCVNLGGAPLILGILGTAATNQPRIGQTIVQATTTVSATAGTNTSNTTYATVRSVNWDGSDIPDGTYNLMVDWSAQFSDSASGSINVRLTVGATVDTVFTVGMSTNRERLAFAREFNGVALTGGVTVTIEYKRNSGTGTATAANPRIVLLATRVGV